MGFPFHRCMPVLAIAPLLFLPSGARGEGSASAPLTSGSGALLADTSHPETATRLARRIAGELEAGRVQEARIDADNAIKQLPKEALLHLRLAQAEFSTALELDRQFSRVAEDLNLSRALEGGLQTTHNLLTQRSTILPNRRSLNTLVRISSGPKRSCGPQQRWRLRNSFRSARQELGESGALVEQRTQALQAAEAALDQARQLDGGSMEAALTGLWVQMVPLLWRAERTEFSTAANPGPPGPATAAPVSLPFEALDKALVPFSDISTESVLRAAARVAKQYPQDPTALAGAADVISTVGALAQQPDLLRDHVRSLLDHAYLKHPERYNPDATATVRMLRRQLYQQLRDARDPDVVRFPTAVVLQLYEAALKHDPNDALPWLRLRVYLQRVAFEPGKAQPLLEELARQEPGDAVVPLERARLAFMLEDDPARGMELIRAAARLREFSRSYLVAVPAPLHTALKFQARVRDIVKNGWPGYGWLFGTLGSMRTSRLELQRLAELHRRPELPDDERTVESDIPLLQVKLTGANELAGLGLQLAQLFCRAPDYADQLQGIDEQRSALDFLATWAKLPPDQQALVRRLQLDHERAFASYPRSRTWISLTANGLEVAGPRRLFANPFTPAGPRIEMAPRGLLLFR